tara:strand:- start:40 stop:471 length:432 start_codon:yes stop_codon:yes gene_type:complete
MGCGCWRGELRFALAQVSGHCLCGACRFRLTGPHNWVGHCYCQNCRRATAAPFTTFIGHSDGCWSWTGAEPATFQSRADVTRGFCATCGTPMYYRSARYPTETHFYAALLENADLLKPNQSYHADDRLSWMPHLDVDAGGPAG